MSQKLVFLLLKELGGRATLKQVKELAKKRYPQATLWHYSIQRLRQLSKWGYVEYMPDGTWKIVKELDY